MRGKMGMVGGVVGLQWGGESKTRWEDGHRLWKKDDGVRGKNTLIAKEENLVQKEKTCTRPQDVGGNDHYQRKNGKKGIIKVEGEGGENRRRARGGGRNRNQKESF